MSSSEYVLTPAPPVGSIWRQEDGRLVRVVAIGDGYAWVRFANTTAGHSWQVLIAWFGEWERTS